MSIIQKMLLTLLLIALAPAFVVGSIFYFNTESSLQQRELDKLTAIATIQQSRVEVLIDQNKEILGRLNNRLSTRQAMDHYNRTQNGGDKAALQQFATDTQASVKGFKAVSVLSPAGEVVASSRSAMVGKNYASEAFFARGKVEDDVTSNFFLGADGQPGLYLVGPLKLDGRLVGVSVVEWDASGLIAAAKDYTGLGETGEIVLVKRDATATRNTSRRCDLTRRPRCAGLCRCPGPMWWRREGFDRGGQRVHEPHRLPRPAGVCRYPVYPGSWLGAGRKN
jgi:C4-dicarboxylate-specific signal transduction histidine kinase